MVKSKMLQYYFISMGILTLGFFLLTACSSSISLTPLGSGTVGILLKDTHTVDVQDPSSGTSLTATQMWITIDKISLISEEDTFLTVYDSTAVDPNTGQPVGPKTFDLLSLHSTADLVALASLPAGTYEKVRFELRTEPGDNYFCTGTGDPPCVLPFRYDLTVPSAKVDVELKPALVVSDGSSTHIVFDFVPDKSIQIIATGGPDPKYLLRPEIHVGLLGSGSMGDFHLEEIELEEFRGVVEATHCDRTPPTLTLRHRRGEGLIEVDLSQALIFGADGNRLTCEELSPALPVEVKGTLQSDGTLLADRVQVKAPESESEGNLSGHEVELSGTLSAVQHAGQEASFELLVGGGAMTYPVKADLRTRVTDERLASGGDDIGVGLDVLADGLSVEVAGTEALGSDPPVIDATEVEIRQ